MKLTVRHRTAVLFLVAAMIVAAATARAVWAQQPDLSEDQQQELMSLVSIVGAALQGQIAPTDEPFGWAND